MVEAAPVTAPDMPERLPMHFELGSTIIDSAIVRPMTFAAYNGFIDEAISMTQPDDIDVRLRRVRMAKQIAYLAGGNAVAVTTGDVLRLPIPDYRIVTGLAPIKMVSEPDGPERQSCEARLPPTVEASARANTGIQNVGDGTATCRMPHATLDEPVFGAAWAVRAADDSLRLQPMSRRILFS